MRRTLLSLLLLVVQPLSASANLGETVAQCVARYGGPVRYTEANAKLPFGTITFVAGGYGLLIFVLNGKEVGARVSKASKDPFSDTEMQTIMNADLGGSTWTPTPSSDPTCLTWTRADHATVLYDKDKHMLMLTSPEMAAALHSAPVIPVSPH
jgi:hypothetical protein